MIPITALCAYLKRNWRRASRTLGRLAEKLDIVVTDCRQAMRRFVRGVIEASLTIYLWGYPSPLYLDLWESSTYREFPARSFSLNKLYAKYSGTRS